MSAPRNRARLVAAFLLAWMPAAAAIEGYQLVAIGPVQRGTGGSGVASPEDSTWVLLNPAALVDLEPRLDAYFEYIDLERRVRPGGIIQNPFVHELSDDAPMVYPSFSLLREVGDWSVGLGVLGFGGTEVRYKHPRSWLGLWRNSDRRSTYEVVKIPLAVAHEFDNGWAIGLGLHGDVARARMDSVTTRLTPAAGDFAWDEALGFGLAVGLYKRWEHWSLGAHYQSRQWFTDFDEYGDLIAYNIDIPQVLQAGLSYRPSARLELSADYKFIDYSSVRLLRTEGIRGGLGWEDQHLLKLGARYRAGERWTLRAGFAYGDSPIDREEVFMNAHFPALAQTHLSAGASWAIRPNRTLHLAYTYSLPETMSDSGKGDLFSLAGRGTAIDLHKQVFSVGYTFHF